MKGHMRVQQCRAKLLSGGENRTKWRRYYFVIYSSGLYWWHTPEEANNSDPPVGVILHVDAVENCKTESIHDVSDGAKLGFVVTESARGDPGGKVGEPIRSFFVCTSSLKRDKWVESLKRSFKIEE